MLNRSGMLTTLLPWGRSLTFRNGGDLCVHWVQDMAASKSWLITKEGFHSAAMEAFGGTDVKITTEGRPYLGSPVGTTEYTDSYIMNKVQEWREEIELLATFGKTQPHAAHSAFTHCQVSKWSYLSRTTRQQLTRLLDSCQVCTASSGGRLKKKKQRKAQSIWLEIWSAKSTLYKKTNWPTNLWINLPSPFIDLVCCQICHHNIPQPANRMSPCIRSSNSGTISCPCNAS